MSLEKDKNDPICGYFCSRGTLRVPARNVNNYQNDPIVGHFERKMLIVGIKMPCILMEIGSDPSDPRIMKLGRMELRSIQL